MQNLKELFLLDPQVTFLNHGSFGACPKPVFATYQGWQRELERQPVEFLGRRANSLMAEARASLARFLGVQADEVVYFTNPTMAINMIAHSLRFLPGDEILTTDHEYGAMDRTWRFICKASGARYLHIPIPLPLPCIDDFVECFWSGVTSRTRVIFLSHITSPTALTFPVAEICRRARAAGILTIIDGAHAPGQIPLNLEILGADLYIGACHKWLMAPKGAAFLYARREVQSLLEPLVVSWGYESEFPSGSNFIDHHEWQGTRDLAAFLSVPAAIKFQQDYGWENVRRECHLLARETGERIQALTGLPPLCTDDPEPGKSGYAQMFAARLPASFDLDRLKTRLYEIYNIEVPTILWNQQKFLRVSIQGYNTQTEMDALLLALEKELALCD